MKSCNSQFLLTYISAVFVGVIMLSINTSSWLYNLLALINAEITTIMLFTYKDSPFCLHKIVNLFILFFFVISNAIQFSTNTMVSSIPVRLDAYDFENFQVLTFFIIVSYNFLYPLFKNTASTVRNNDHRFLSPIILIVICLFSAFWVVYSFRGNLTMLFVRGLLDETAIEGSGVSIAENVIFEHIIRPLPFACYLLSKINGIEKRYRIILFSLMLLTVFPTSLARSATAMYWIPVLIVNFKLMWKPNIFILAMLIGLLVVFPFLNIFRLWSEDARFSLSLDFLNSMHFDSSQEFMIVLKKDVVTMGSQLLGAILYFVPRTIWPDKPIGSGTFVANDYGAFSNISMPFFAEGYINYGFCGIGLFVFLLAFFSSKIDNSFWKSSMDYRKNISPYYYVLVGAFLFILRGDLMSSWAFASATLIDIYIVNIVAEKRC